MWEKASISSLRKAWHNLLPESDPDKGMSNVPTDSPNNDVVQTATPPGKDTQDAVVERMEAVHQ